MADRPRTFGDQFKADALNLVETSGKSVAQVARELGISQGTLQNWVKKARQDQPVFESDHELSSDERAELVELRNTVQCQAQELEIPGKATKWFADRSL